MNKFIAVVLLSLAVVNATDIEDFLDVLSAENSVEERDDTDTSDSNLVPRKVTYNSTNSMYRPETWDVYHINEEKRGYCPKRTIPPMISMNCNKPRPRMIALEYHSTTDSISPNMVEVLRCDGSCSSGLSCMPEEVFTSAVTVTKIPHIGRPSCGTVLIENHKSCKCKCAVSESDCDPEQQDYKDCRCVCRDSNKRKNCELMNRQWDQRTCKCMCAKESLCSTGEIFHQPTCKCEQYKVMMSNEI